MDAEGYANIVGRSKDMVIRGGENVYPREIEELLYAHPTSPMCRSSESPTSVTERSSSPGSSFRRSATLDRDGVDEFCRGRIAHNKIPRYVRLN